MGYNVVPYVVPDFMWEDLRDKEDYVQEYGRRAARRNPWRAEMDLTAALEQMTAGGKFDQEPHLYWYGLSLLCEEYEGWLDVDWWRSIPHPTQLIDEVKVALTAAGFPQAAKVVHAMFFEGTPPIDLPRPADFPIIGYIPPGELPSALATLGAVKLSVVNANLATGIREIISWMREGVEGKRGLLTFVF